AAQLYDGTARWEYIAELKAGLTIPVLGNGDIWEAEDALRMMRQTGCDGVIVGRGCLGRPWLFRDLASVFRGEAPPNPPRLGEVCATMRKHAVLLCEWMGEGSAIRSFRRHTSWYTKGFRGSAVARSRFMQVRTLAELDEVIATLDPSEAFPPQSMRVPRGKTAGTQVVSLPDGYLDDLDDATPPLEEDHVEGG
ncbi:MAG TPA: tRNA-dihydrouridine synthase, partial [Polyangiaceae bacterium]|nr:tRNA-dihydrouridine synthase [Polyangiaceae bacterium]